MPGISSIAMKSIDWVVLTMGTRPTEFDRAVESIERQRGEQIEARPVVVSNGADLSELRTSRPEALLVELDENVGIPGGRNRGVDECATPIVGLLDDDAELDPQVSEQVLAAFEADPRLGAVALRLVDERGDTTRRHIPRPGRRSASRGGEVVYFVGAAHAIRVEAFHQVGGYYADLWYGHEEIELCWRLIDGGWSVRYLADAVAFHPKTTISRHRDGWSNTGRNRVRIARRTLPWPIAFAHVITWLVLGTVRAPRGCRGPYVRGWMTGWRDDVSHNPIQWRTVWRLSRLGRPPVI